MRRLLLVGAWVATWLAWGCGSTATTPEGETARGGGETARAGGGTARGAGQGEPGEVHGGLTLALPSAEAAEEDRPPRHEGAAPAVRAIDDAERALASGWYAEAERYLRGDRSGRAQVALGRVQLETGRYDEAIATAQAAARSRDVKVAADTLRGEALMRRGRLDDAEAALAEAARDPAGLRASVWLGRLLARRGRATDAEPHFMRLVSAYNDGTIDQRNGEGLSYVGMAAWGLGSFRDANDAFIEATRAAPDRVETQVEWARMFLEKYDAGHAEESLREAFRVNPACAEAHVVMARVRLEQSFDFAAATAYSERALEVSPNLVAAHVTLAGMDLRDLEIGAADAHLDTALAVDPSDLEALSVRAAVRFLADDDRGFDRAKREVLARNPRFSRMYSIIGEYADWEHRYPEMVVMAREAVALDGNDAFAHATLGLNLLRMGDEPAGLAALREAWRRDRFNVHVYNTLNLYDDVIGPSYEEVTADPFVFRFHREERPVLSALVVPTLQGAYADMRRRYGIRPEGPLRIEMFADPQHFAVRTTGLPSLGVQGVCFGKVVTAISPRGAPFNWGQITWHELAHVFHIQLSRNHVPRWFTEGLAEYETIIARPEWKREDDYQLYAALTSGRLPALRQMNRAFTHARSANDMMVAYYASSMIVKFIVDTFGFEKVVVMLREWGAGRTSADVVQRGLGISIDDLDRRFREHTLRRLAARARDFTVDFAAYTELPPLREAAGRPGAGAEAHAALAAGLFVNGQMEEAKAAAERAIAADARQATARFVLAQIALGTNDPATAETHLRALIAAGKDGYDVRVSLARAATGRRDMAGVRRELEAATAIDGDRGEAWQALGAIANEAHDAELRARVVERLARIDQHDREAWGEWLAILEERQRWPDLVDAARGAQMVSPYDPEVHRRLGEALLQTNHPREAIAAFDLALLNNPEDPAPIQAARTRAQRALRP